VPVPVPVPVPFPARQVGCEHARAPRHGRALHGVASGKYRASAQSSQRQFQSQRRLRLCRAA